MSVVAPDPMAALARAATLERINEAKDALSVVRVLAATTLRLTADQPERAIASAGRDLDAIDRQIARLESLVRGGEA